MSLPQAGSPSSAYRMAPMPILLRHATPMFNPQAQPHDQIVYDPRTQMSREIVQYGSSERTGCTKATHSTPSVGKDPEGDYAADDY